MTTRMLEIAHMYAMAAAMSYPYAAEKKTRIEDLDLSPKQPPIPKGCKEYYFNHLGDFVNHNDGVYAFKCVASNDKTAINKFNKWASKQK